MYSKEESKNLRTDFWQGFKHYSSPKRRAVDLPKKWMLNKTGIKSVQLKFDIDRNRAFAGVEIHNSDIDKHQIYYHKFVSLKVLLEQELGFPLVWEELCLNDTEKEISRVYRQIDNVDIYDKKCWEKVYAFFVETMLPLEQFFIEYRDFIGDV